MNDTIVTVRFTDLGAARRALRMLKLLDSEGQLRVRAAALVERPARGRVGSPSGAEDGERAFLPGGGVVGTLVRLAVRRRRVRPTDRGLPRARRAVVPGGTRALALEEISRDLEPGVALVIAEDEDPIESWTRRSTPSAGRGPAGRRGVLRSWRRLTSATHAARATAAAGDTGRRRFAGALSGAGRSVLAARNRRTRSRQASAAVTIGTRSPSSQKATGVPIWSTIQPKFIPKKPVMNVSGTKIVATTLTRYARWLSWRSSSMPMPLAAASIDASRWSTCSSSRSKNGSSSVSKPRSARISTPSRPKTACSAVTRRRIVARLAPVSCSVARGTTAPSSSVHVAASASRVSSSSSRASKALASMASRTE